jgi:hypothetical protein
VTTFWRLVCVGEDIGAAEGVFKTTTGLFALVITDDPTKSQIEAISALVITDDPTKSQIEAVSALVITDDPRTSQIEAF